MCRNGDIGVLNRTTQMQTTQTPFVSLTCSSASGATLLESSSRISFPVGNTERVAVFAKTKGMGTYEVNNW